MLPHVSSMDTGQSYSRPTLMPHDLYFCAIPWHQRSSLELSTFDLQLRKEWQDSLSRGIFLHGVESEPIRMYGKRGFVAVLCRNRAAQKRKPQSFMKILQDLDPKSFNFTKVKKDEVLFHIKIASQSSTNNEKILILENSTSDTNTFDEREQCKTAVIINNSPYEFGHSLLVPEPNKLLIQSITLDAIKMGIEMLLWSSHPGFRLMYNSMCAGASVNHLHLHCYYTEYWLPSEAFRMKPLQFPADQNLLLDCFELDFLDSCVRGFGFIITSRNYASTLPKILYKVVQYFNMKNIAHNIVIIRGLPPNETYMNETLYEKSGESSKPSLDYQQEQNISGNPNIPILNDVPLYYETSGDDTMLRHAPLVGRVYIFPRLPLLGEKCYKKFLVNVTELFSHLYFGDVEVLNSMSEADVVNALHSISLSEEEFRELKNDIVKIITTQEL